MNELFVTETVLCNENKKSKDLDALLDDSGR